MGTTHKEDLSVFIQFKDYIFHLNELWIIVDLSFMPIYWFTYKIDTIQLESLWVLHELIDLSYKEDLSVVSPTLEVVWLYFSSEWAIIHYWYILNSNIPLDLLIYLQDRYTLVIYSYRANSDYYYRKIFRFSYTF